MTIKKKKNLKIKIYITLTTRILINRLHSKARSILFQFEKFILGPYGTEKHLSAKRNLTKYNSKQIRNEINTAGC